MSVAIAHEHFIDYGGGEYVATELADIFDAPIYTGAAAPAHTPEDCDVRPITGGRLGRLLTRRGVALRDAYYWYRWPSVDLTEYDAIIQSGNNPGWYVPEDTQAVVRYTHSTPRGPYDLYHEHDHGPFETVFNHAVRTLYQQTIPYPDLYVANSELVARRLRRYFGVPEEKLRVVYPPVKTGQFSPRDAETGDAYVTWGRLHGHKNVETIVRAFTGTDRELVVGGEGPQRAHLESIAGDNVRFTGWLTETEKARLASAARAVVFAATNEDFGLVPVEAMAAGTPVIGINEGFTRFQIRDGRNGRHFDGSVAGLGAALDAFEADGVAWDAERIQRFASQFSRQRFAEAMERAVGEALDRATVTADITAEGGQQ